MPAIRRYVRISPHSCLEVRIFVDNPADISTWLLRPSKPALTRVFTAVKPLILPKLKEENERTRLAKGKSGKKKKGVKDVVHGDDFEVVVFLTEGQGRHEVVVKRKEAREGSFGQYQATTDQQDEPVIIHEEDEGDDSDINMADIPAADSEADDDEVVTTKVRKRPKTTVHDGDEGTEDANLYQDEKKKVKFKTRYDGFSIWGKVLCLLVERKATSTKRAHSGDSNRNTNINKQRDGNHDEEGAQQALMQEWISSTQLPPDEDDYG